MALFGALLTGDLRDKLHSSLDFVAGRRDLGLRVRLLLDPSHPELALLCNLPWELLHSDRYEYLALSRLSPVVRQLDVPIPTRPPAVAPTLRVLVVPSCPEGLDSLDLQKERLRMAEALADAQDIRFEPLLAPTVDSLREALLRHEYHALHFMGHGDFDGQEGVLFFEGSSGEPFPVTGRGLATMLRDIPSLRLVVLNACDSGRSGDNEEEGPLAGIATALLLAGLPAVVAMQMPISDRAAITFSRAVYRRLAAGDPIESAVSEGRLLIYQDRECSHEWATPVVYLRASDGRLFADSMHTFGEAQIACERLVLDELLSGLVAAGRCPDLPGHTSEEGTPPGVRASGLMNYAEQRGEESWIRLQESVLKTYSPLDLLSRSSKEWVGRPDYPWRVARGKIQALGSDPDVLPTVASFRHYSLLIWQGLRFRDGSVNARLWLPTIREGGAGGLMLRFLGRSGVVGIIRHHSERSVLGEIWQLDGDDSVLLARTQAPLPEPEADSGWYDLHIEVRGSQCSLEIEREAPVQASLSGRITAGYAGIVRFEDALTRVADLHLVVAKTKHATEISPSALNDMP
jgi:hypothetical protein